MSDRGLPKICLVCGHKALGKNFGALSCEPCKAFFRRNALKSNLKCHFESKCKIDEITRKFCSKCRLDKCLAIGMRRDFLLNEVEKDWRRSKSQAHRDRYKTDGIIKISDLQSNSSGDQMDEMSGDDNFFYELLDDNNFSVEELNKQIKDIEKSVVINGQSNDKNLHQISLLAPKSNDGNNDLPIDVLQMAVEFELAVIPIARPVGEYRCDFNDTESHLLSELFESIKIIGQPMSQHTMEITNVDDFTHTISFKFDRGIRNFTRAAKQLSTFRCIGRDDQISLLKYGCIEGLMMRTVMHVNYPEQRMTVPWDSQSTITFNLNFLKSYKSFDIYTTYINYLQKIEPIWDSDPAIIDLMMAIILFNPDRPNLINRDVVKLQQHIYMYLLQRYLILKYRSECEAKSRFLRLMTVFNDLNVLREIQKRLAINMTNQSHHVPPLVQEVFDIQPLINGTGASDTSITQNISY